MLYDSFTEVFLPLWRVPDILSYNCTHLCIKVLDKRTQHLIHIFNHTLSKIGKSNYKDNFIINVV